MKCLFAEADAQSCQSFARLLKVLPSEGSHAAERVRRLVQIVYLVAAHTLKQELMWLKQFKSSKLIHPCCLVLRQPNVTVLLWDVCRQLFKYY